MLTPRAEINQKRLYSHRSLPQTLVVGFGLGSREFDVGIASGSMPLRHLSVDYYRLLLFCARIPLRIDHKADADMLKQLPRRLRMKSMNQNRIPSACALFVSLLLSSTGYPQKLDQDLLNSAVLIHYQTDPIHEKRGSGFIIVREVSPDPETNEHRIQLVLITNKHVLPEENSTQSSINLRIEIRDQGQKQVKNIPVKVLGEDGKYLRTVALHPDRLVDVAAVNITKDLKKANAELLTQILETHRAVTTHLLLKKADMAEAAVGAGTQIYLLGYPAGVYDPKNAHPILRIGIISTEPDQDYSFDPGTTAKYGLPDPIPGFLIDANVFPGSSGSMVLRRTNIVPGFSTEGKQSVPYILGIVADSIPIDDLWGTTRMGLGVVFGAETILATIDRLPVD